MATSTTFASTTAAAITTAAMVARSQKGIAALFDVAHGDSSALDRLSPGEAVLVAVPEADLVLAELPAQQHVLAVPHRGEVHEARVEVLDDHAQRLDLL